MTEREKCYLCKSTDIQLSVKALGRMVKICKTCWKEYSAKRAWSFQTTLDDALEEYWQ